MLSGLRSSVAPEAVVSGLAPTVPRGVKAVDGEVWRAMFGRCAEAEPDRENAGFCLAVVYGFFLVVGGRERR